MTDEELEMWHRVQVLSAALDKAAALIRVLHGELADAAAELRLKNEEIDCLLRQRGGYREPDK